MAKSLGGLGKILESRGDIFFNFPSESQQGPNLFSKLSFKKLFTNKQRRVVYYKIFREYLLFSLTVVTQRIIEKHNYNPSNL
jgi:hypothetical protein